MMKTKTMNVHTHAETLASLQWLHTIAMVLSCLASCPCSRAQEHASKATVYPEYFQVKFRAFSSQCVLAKTSQSTGVPYLSQTPCVQ